jgi:plasmid stabilization system protein ParE
MPRLIWPPSAQGNAQRLYRALAVKEGDATRRAVVTIRQSVKTIARQPGIGRQGRDRRGCSFVPVDNAEHAHRPLIGRTASSR